MNTSHATPLASDTAGGPVPLTFDEIEAVGGGTPPLVLAAAFAAGCVVGTTAVVVGAALGAAAGAAANAASSSESEEKEPIIAPGT